MSCWVGFGIEVTLEGENTLGGGQDCYHIVLLYKGPMFAISTMSLL